MASLKLYLTIPETLARKIKAEKEQDSYFTLQEVILNTLRQKYKTHTREEGNENYEVRSKKTEARRNKKETRGRPKKFNDEQFLTRPKNKPIFTLKKGKKYMY